MKYVISLGGSVINPGALDAKFLRDFVELLQERFKKGDSFYIVTGGGAPARAGIARAKREGTTDRDELDWIGIKATNENAEILIDQFDKDDPVEVRGGEKPGQSTDTVAVKVAIKNKVNTVVNLSNIDYVYTADPRADKDAKKIESITYKDILNLIGEEIKPGGNYPFDPVAIQLAEKENIKVVVMNGRKLKNFKDFLNKKKFKGTVVN